MTDASHTPEPELTAEERELGMDRDITRRDFLNTVALGTGAALLGAPAPGLVPKAAAQAPVPIRRRRGIHSRATRGSATTRARTATPGTWYPPATGSATAHMGRRWRRHPDTGRGL